MAVIDVRSELPVADLWYRKQRPGGSDDVEIIAIHYTLTTIKVTATVAEEKAHLQQIHAFHRDTRDWGGVGYHFIGFPSRRMYYTFDVDRWGANVAGMNDKVVGIAGVFNDDGPPSETLQGAYREAIDFLDGGYLSSYKRMLRAHRQLVSTSCPGANFAQWVPLLRDKGEALGSSKEDDMALDEVDKQWLSALGRNIVKAITEGPFASALQGDPNYANAKYDLKDILTAVASIQAAGGGATDAQVEAAVRKVLKEGVG